MLAARDCRPPPFLYEVEACFFPSAHPLFSFPPNCCRISSLDGPLPRLRPHTLPYRKAAVRGRQFFEAASGRCFLLLTTTTLFPPFFYKQLFPKASCDPPAACRQDAPSPPPDPVSVSTLYIIL